MRLFIKEVKLMSQNSKQKNKRSQLFIFSIGIIAFGLLFSPFPGQLKATNVDAEEAADVLKKVAPSVVKVEVADGLKRVATGVVIDREGSIVTTALISPRQEKITVKANDGRTYEAKYAGFDPVTRLALLQIKEKGLPPLAMASSKEAVAGAWVAVISISPEDTPAITQGIISSVSEDRLRLNVSVLPGASGSPVVNRKGEMLGLLRGPYAEGGPVVFEFREREVVGSGYVLGRGETPASGLALAVPVELVKKIAAEIREKGRTERGWLGVSLEEDSNGRVRVTNVIKKSPAEEAGLREGDVILKINGREVRDGDYLAREIRNHRPGEEVRLEIERNGKTQEIKAKLGAYPEEEARRELELRLPEFFRSWPAVPPERPARPSEWPRILERRRFIGIYPEEIGSELANYFGVKEGRGLLVTRIEKDSPAERAGVKVGDVIVRADGQTVETVDQLSSLIQRKKKGDKVQLEIVRDRKPLSLEVEIEEEERGLSFSAPEWNKFWSDLERQSQQLQERMRKIQQEQSARVKENWKRITEEMERWKQEFSLRLKEYQEKAKEYQEKIKEMAKKKLIVC